MVGCGKEFMNDEAFGLKDGQGFAPQIRRTCGLGAVGEEYLCPNCSPNLNKEKSE